MLGHRLTTEAAQSKHSSFPTMRVLVTGGNGFIGRKLVSELLHSGHSVCVFDVERSSRLGSESHFERPTEVLGSLERLDQVRDAAHGCDLIYHLGGVVGTDWLLDKPRLAVTANIVGTLNVLEIAREMGSKVVFASLRPNWANSYMITKQAATAFCTMYGRELNTDVLSVRLPHVYGPGQSWKPARKVVPTFVRAALGKRPLPVYGTGMQPRLAASCTLPAGDCIDVSSTIDIPLLELARHVCLACEQPFSIEKMPRRRGEAQDLCEFPSASTSQGNLAIGFAPRMGLDEGLERTVTWMRSVINESVGSEQHV
jgi:nucleoside-diphosphate-sugar epimerase